MKLQAKFTINFILLVVVTIAVSFFIINLSLQSQFNHFIQQKNQQWQDQWKGVDVIQKNGEPGPTYLIMQNPFDNPPSAKPETPERAFIQTVTNSLLWAAVIDISLAVILAYFLSSLLLQRIYKLKSAMHEYMEDGKSKPITHENKDEVDELAHIYNLLIEKIEKEEKIRKDFFIDMSHELRTPLTSVKGYLEGLIDKVFENGKEDEIHKKTLTETTRMIRLVKEMTTLAKLETEEINLSREEVDLRKVTENVLDTFSKAITERNLTTELEGEVKANVDPHKIKQVIINLVDNAIQYGKPAGKILIEMGQNKDITYWRIKNMAENIKKEDLENFFERFYRNDKSRKYDSKKQHLGIGLNIVKKIVEQHNGEISAYLEGEYVVFAITLPSDHNL